MVYLRAEAIGCAWPVGRPASQQADGRTDNFINDDEQLVGEFYLLGTERSAPEAALAK